jgi:hypothetical protein
MTVAGTDRTITVDANVVSYYFSFKNKHIVPKNMKIQRINDFCNYIMDKFPIAINKHIRSEYININNYELMKNWLKIRFQKNLAINVDCSSLPSNVKNCIRDDYGFDCRSTDYKYLQTCLNTIFKLLVTENTIHFCRQHRNRRRRSMPVYLEHTLGIHIYIIDECCKILLDC